jgi:SulP family sulfate permease
MAVDGLWGDRGLLTRGVGALAGDLYAGVVCAIISIALALSFATLIFNGPLTPWLAYGIAASFIASSIAGLVVALGSSLPFSIAGPDSSTSAVTAALVGAVTQHLAASGADDRLLVSALIVMPISAAMTGLLLCGLGVSHSGRAIRFIPYPVVGGFLGATGALLVSGAYQILIDRPLAAVALTDFLIPVNVSKIAASTLVAGLLLLSLRWLTSATATASVLFLCSAFAYAVMTATGTSLTEAQAAGWMFKSQATHVLDLPWHADWLELFPWRQLPSLAGDLVAVMFVTAISTLLNTTAIEYASYREADLDCELTTLGIANLCSAALGGYVSCISLSRTLLNHSMGATSRLSGLIVAGSCAFMLTVDPALLGYVPKLVLGGLLLYLGGGLIYQWLINSAVRLSVVEYLSLLAIAVIIVKWGFIAGVLSGVVIGCASFALSASRINAIKYSFDGSEMRSSLDRSPSELALLAQNGTQIQVMSLHTYLFFGSASGLHQHVKELLMRRPECRFLVFDFRMVTGVDASAMHSFAQIKRAADEHDVRLVMVKLNSELEKAFRAIGVLSNDVLLLPELDQALETCEDVVIRQAQGASARATPLHEWLSEALGSRDYADALASACVRIEVAAGDIVAQQGDTADAMHFIVDGRLGILVDTGERQVRVRSLGPHTTVGEMGLISRQPRNATIRAEKPSVLYVLSLDAYERIKLEKPAVGQALLSYIVIVIAERLSFANRVIGVLQR